MVQLLVHHQHGTALPVGPHQIDDLLARSRKADPPHIDLVVPVRIDDQRSLKGRAVIAVPLEAAILERRGEDEQGVFHAAVLAPDGRPVSPGYTTNSAFEIAAGLSASGSLNSSSHCTPAKKYSKSSGACVSAMNTGSIGFLYLPAR